MDIEKIAIVCHETNRAFCQSIGDDSQPDWQHAPDWQRTSAINGVKFHIANPNAKPSQSHDSWLAEKKAAGWKYGPVKDPENKEHPCFIPYDQLPEEQKAKDALFIGIVHSLVGLLGMEAPPKSLTDCCTEMRTEIKVIEIKARHMAKNVPSSQPQAFDGQHGEMIAQTMLAVRHLEDARLRLGKVIQYSGDGVSIYDKA